MNKDEETRLLHEAIEFHNQGKLVQAEVIYRSILAQNPLNVLALRFLGCLCRKTQAYAEGIELLERAVSINPLDADSLYSLGNILADSGSHLKAISALERCIQINPHSAPAKATLGWSLFHIRDFNASANVLRQAVSIDPTLFQAWLNLGNTLKSQGLLDESIDSYRRATSIQPENLQAQLNLADSLSAKGHHAEPIAIYRRLHHRYPTSTEVLINLARIYQETNNLEESEIYLEKALAINPLCIDALFLLGLTQNAQKKYNQAILAFQSVLQQDSYFPGGLYFLIRAIRERDQVSSCPISLVTFLSSTIRDVLGCTQIIAFGDSHISVYKEIYGFEDVWVGAATAYNLTSPNSHTQARTKILAKLSSVSPESTAVLLSFGEVDCRSNIVKYAVKNQKTIASVCSDVVNRYMEFIDEIASMSFQVLVNGPYGTGDDHNNQGTMNERFYASALVDELLRENCIKRKVPYFSLHGILSNYEQSRTRTEFFEDGLHFPGHNCNQISSDIKAVVLSQMLASIQKSFVIPNSYINLRQEGKPSSLTNDAIAVSGIYTGTPTINSLLSLQSRNTGSFAASSISEPFYVDLGACCHLSQVVFCVMPRDSDQSLTLLRVSGFDNLRLICDATINIDNDTIDSSQGLMVSAEFPSKNLIRYLFFDLPPGQTINLQSLDVL